MTYPVIDVEKTGRRLRQLCVSRGISVRELQQFLGLTAAQSIYSWFQGKTLPSLDNLFALSRYFGMEIDALVVPKGAYGTSLKRRQKRMEIRRTAYFCFLLEAADRQRAQADFEI